MLPRQACFPSSTPHLCFPNLGKKMSGSRNYSRRQRRKNLQPRPHNHRSPFAQASPVNEASPDLEHSDHSTPPKTPETPYCIGTLHPRFNVRPLYQHVSSPYPHHRGFTYGKTSRFSPQPYASPQTCLQHFQTQPYHYQDLTYVQLFQSLFYKLQKEWK